MRRICVLGAALLAIFSSVVAVRAQSGGERGGGTGPVGGGAPGSGGVLGPTSVSMGAPSGPIEEGTAALSGVVIDGATKAPIADAVVYLGLNGSGLVGSQNRQITDAKGRFAFVNLPAKGNVTIGATKPGFLPGGFSRDNRPGTINAPFSLRENEWIGDVQIPIWRPGSISGMVTDERGEPVVGVFVRVLARLRIGGNDTLAGGPVTKTDDRGMYRAAGLGPGRYLVIVPSIQATIPTASVLAQAPRPANAPPIVPEPSIDVDSQTRLVLRNYPTPPPPAGGIRFSYPIVFHPHATSLSSAATIDLKFGDERSNVDIALQPVTSWRVSGVVQGPPESLTNLTLRLIPQGFERLGYGSEAATAFVDAGGQFTFLNVPDGTYTIDAPRTVNELRASSTPTPVSMNFPPPPRPGSPGWGMNSSGLDAAPPGVGIESRHFGATTNYFGRVTVTVSGRDEAGVVLPIVSTGTMNGRIRIESSGDPPAGTFRPEPSASMRLDPANGDPARGPLRSTRADDGFSVQGLMPGPYFLRADSAWSIKSITWQGRDYTDAPFDAATNQDFSGVEVVVTDVRPTLTGTVRDGDGKIVPGTTVVAFSTNESHWTNRGLIPSRMQSATASRTGVYRFASLPAGDYFVVIVDPSQNASKFEPEFFRTVSASAAATRVSLAWGEMKTVDLSAR